VKVQSIKHNDRTGDPTTCHRREAIVDLVGYDLAKATINRLALGSAHELGRHGVTALG
jgi:hypothetical protein